MSRRLVPAVVAVAALALVGFPGTADADSGGKNCFGRAGTVVGTNGHDDIYVSADEAGAFIRINGEEWYDDTIRSVSIVAGPGDDKVTFKSDGGGSAVVCTGRGDDNLEGTMVSRASTGPGDDRVALYLQCGKSPDIYDAEEVRITGFDSVEEGPCN